MLYKLERRQKSFEVGSRSEIYVLGNWKRSLYTNLVSIDNWPEIFSEGIGKTMMTKLCSHMESD